ncbi:terminase small subunit [Desulfovibrio sp. UCD-KL4C]|uniref:terminase small subunit n=1 Tax=Desulfovibrio sp. UCD-KL4C TaxID=2578120 RepID=UPI0025BD6D57|nr:terminase small subunit [Desulfovibrio sp. UCD-KL4C]
MVRESKKKEQKKSTTDRVLVDKQGIALALGISLPTVSVRIREGMPCVQEGGRGKAWQFDLAECVQWHTDRAIEKAVGVTDEGMTRADLLKALLVEDLKIKRVASAQALREVCLLDEVERTVATAFIEVRQAVLALPERVALRLLAVDSEIEIKTILEEELELALRSLSEAELIEEVMDDTGN